MEKPNLYTTKRKLHLHKRPLEFATKFPDEASCVAKMREVREAETHVCPKCGHTE